MPAPFTLREISSAVAKAENRPDEERIFQQLKGATARGLLKHTDTYGPKGALRFSLEEVAKARLILRAVDSGMSGKALKDFENGVRVETRKALANGSHVILSLSAAVSSVMDTNWLLEVVETRGSHDEDTYGEPLHLISWLPNGARFGDTDPRDPEVGIPGKVIEEIRLIPFSKLIRPIFEVLETD